MLSLESVGGGVVNIALNHDFLGCAVTSLRLWDCVLGEIMI